MTHAVAVLTLLLAPAFARVQDDDPYLWLEQIESTRALSWVQLRNDRTMAELGGDARYARTLEELRAVLNAQDRIPEPESRGGWVYNLWQDSTNVRGLWRRARQEEFGGPAPRWQTLLDVDALGRAEGESWVWRDPVCLPPKHERCVLRLSRGGTDAEVLREYDVISGTWTPGGFTLAEGEHQFAWYGKDALLIAPHLGPDSVNKSGMPRLMRLWRRGTPIETAKVVYEADADDVHLEPSVRERTEGRLALIHRYRTFYETEHHLLGVDGRTRRLPLPGRAEIRGWFQRRVLVQLRDEWKLGVAVYPAGALIAVPDDAEESSLAGRVELVYAPDARSSLTETVVLLSAVYLRVLENVSGRLYRAQRRGTGWTLAPVALPEHGTIKLKDADERRDELFLSFESFTIPPTLYLIARPGAEPRPLKALPARFDGAGLETSQHEAVSADGTRVPYFLVRRKDAPNDGSTPTLLTGYGGFEQVRGPVYLDAIGKGWLEKGGAYALATVRGGGEFGPAWHQAALKTNRPRSFEDLIAVGEDLAARRVTSPRRLGIMGGSNGGLLVGAAMVRRPELFRAVVCEKPLLDMLRFHLLPPGGIWKDEYGDPDGPERDAIRGYSPYHAVRPGVSYPRALFVTAANDRWVHPGHARKMAARLEEVGAGPLYYENAEGGHRVSADQEQLSRRYALEYAYLYRRLMD